MKRIISLAIFTAIATANVLAHAQGTGTGTAAKVNINKASQAEFETLPGVGPVKAKCLVTWRTEHKTFATIDQLKDTKCGIGPKTLDKVRPLVTLK